MKDIRIASVALATLMSACFAVAEDSATTPNAGTAEVVASAKKDGESEKQYKPLAEARAQIGDIISNPEKMSDVMKELSAEDQKAFLADVNAAVSKLPGSVEDKTAKYLNINRAALKGASAGNMANVLAVVFATVPPESLTVLAERFATDLFNRDADPSRKFTDEAFEKTAKEVIGKVVQATAGSDDDGVRNTMAVIMFLKASNGSIDGLSERLVETLPNSEIREFATKEWIPAAMAEGDKKSYDAMLAHADAGKAPNLTVVMSLAGPQILDALLVDITSGMLDHNGYQTAPVLEQIFVGSDVSLPVLMDTTGVNSGMNETPRTQDPTKPWNPQYQRGSTVVSPDAPEEPEPKPVPPYPYTSM